MSLNTRYRDAYAVANSTESMGQTLKAIGVILGLLILVAALWLMEEAPGGLIILLAGIAFAFIAGTFFYVLGMQISAQGQMLKATLDSAVNSSPFLTNEQKATIMSVTPLLPPFNSQQSPQVAEGENRYYSRNDVLVTNKRLVVPPNEWPIEQFQPVKVKLIRGKYCINLLDKRGKQIHFLESDSQERIDQIAEAINKALQAEP